tara:strand:- start:238 stop:1233 length:996 start_codon:yes stop_codon:yes gene_type:complete
MKKILLLQTGGTISMHLEKGITELNPDKWSTVLYNEMPELQQIAEITVQNVFFEDSSDMNQFHWNQLANIIDDLKDSFDGFVILHGTDTMAYTASALSFALRNLQKPVILTGSQVPMSNIRSDARRNLVNAVELATCELNEVAICFNDHLYRGNRSTKMSINDFDAFTSPNYPALAEIGININISQSANQKSHDSYRFLPSFSDAVHLLKVYPGLNPEYLTQLNLSHIKAIIIEAYGIGNIPIKDKYSLLPFVERCLDHNCHVIINSQVAYDSVDLNVYESGRILSKLGCLSAGEMTIEATITKTMHLIDLTNKTGDFNQLFMKNIAGERN